MKDTFGREISYLRLSVTELCNLRCRYCMPEDGVCKKRHEDMLTHEEMVMAVRAAASLGITKLRITGGEPLVKPDIVSLCEACSSIDGIRELCLTTNGTLLPKLAEPLLDAGVSRLNISLDTLDAEKYRFITRWGDLSEALRGIERETRGIPEAMRWASLQITPRGCLSRSAAGIRGKTLIVNLPGSEKAAKENLAAVIDPIGHGMDMLFSDGSSDHHHHHH